MLEIQLENCGKSWNRNWLYRNLNVTLQTGEKWALLGANGAGKSTLSLMLASQVFPTEGQILWSLNGKQVPEHKRHACVALASPAMELPEEFNIPEIVQFQSRMRTFKVPNASQAIADICAFSSTTMKKPVSTFSSGMKQRMKLCLAAMADTPLLILDEPLTNLDEAGTRVFHSLLENYTGERLLVIASNRAEEYSMCTRTITLQPGGSAVLNQ
ncbi:MAG: ATP-binding cassette domain-containing protein [Bacteroidetes bacterium]|nr:ATP-binding cassette domain-containing protein [Bacteroidota bacterium]